MNAAGSGNHGRYTSSLKRVAVCWGEPELTNDGANYNGPRIDNLRHEYFHAIQYAYSDSASGWFKESTAVMAEDSLATMVRDTGRAVRDVDVQMNAKPQWYSLQDFWIYLGMRFDLGLADVIPFLEAGGNEAALDAVFASDYPALGSLAGAYWAWVKNQAFEKTFALGGSGFAVMCDLDANNNGAYYALENTVSRPGGAPDALTFDHAAPLSDRIIILPPLTSRVYQLVFPATSSIGIDLDVTVSGGNDVRTKFYDPADAGTGACATDPDSTSLPMVSAIQSETRYLLVANTDASNVRTVTLTGRFAAVQGPGITIVSPLRNASFDENDLITFHARVSGVQWIDPQRVTITWSYQRGGLTTVFATSDSAEIFTRGLCDGNYTVTAEAIDVFSAISASTTTTFVVNDLGSSGNPPAACRPSITILEPRPGQAFADGQLINLRAAITDDHPEIDDPLYPITWRDGGPSGRIIGTGLESSTRLGVGAHQIYVSYGVANSTIGIAVEAGNPPMATITNPASDLFIPWTDVPGCDSIFTLTGTGSDPEDGALTGNSLTWRYRQNGSNSFFLGNGTSIDLNIRCGNTYEVTLIAEDSGGLEDNDTVTITVGAPPS